MAPPGRHVRPTTDRVREALFNALVSLDAVAGARVLDLFAGSGALGIEALSRGATLAVFVEQGRRAQAAVRSNLAATGLADRAAVRAVDAWRFLRAVPAAEERFDLVLLDPPYAFEQWPKLLSELEPWVREGGVVAIESDVAPEPPAWAEMVRVRQYGSTVLTLIRRPLSSQPEPAT